MAAGSDSGRGCKAPEGADAAAGAAGRAGVAAFWPVLAGGVAAAGRSSRKACGALAALTALEPLGVDMIGLNCATGPAEMSEHLRHLSRHAQVGVSCMPNAGLPVLQGNGAHYPLTPAELADAHDTFTREYGLGLVGGKRQLAAEHSGEQKRQKSKALWFRKQAFHAGNF